MFCRKHASQFFRLISSGVVVCLMLAAAPDVSAEHIRIGLVRDRRIDRSSNLPSGEIVILAGYLNGVDQGMTGTIWRKNKYKGRIDVADIEVTEVSAYEATCRYIVRHPDFYVLKKDRAELETVTPLEPDILAKAIESLDNNRCFDALLYFESIFCATIDNGFVQHRIGECLSRVEERLSVDQPDLKPYEAASRMVDYLDLAGRHHKYENDLAADLYLRRALALDNASAQAIELRQTVPEQDYAALLSPDRCK